MSTAASSASSGVIQRVAKELLRRDLFAVIVPTADPHNSEYVAPCFQRRAKLCGFKGSAGTCVVALHNNNNKSEKQQEEGGGGEKANEDVVEAMLWTDGRYFLQAEQELTQGWKLMKQGDPSTPTIEQYLTKASNEFLLKNPYKKSAKIGIDPSTQLYSGWLRYRDTCGLEVVPTESGSNIVDFILNEEQKPSSPPVVAASVDVLDAEKYAGETLATKIDRVAAELKKQQADLTLLSALDEVAWLLNLRNMSCCDIPFAPTFFSFAIVSRRQRPTGEKEKEEKETCEEGFCDVFIDEEKLTQKAKEYLLEANSSKVKVHPYNSLESFCSTSPYFHNNNNSNPAILLTALIPDTSASYDCYRLLKEVAKVKTVRRISAGVVEKMKSIKNKKEIAGFKESHIRDGVALTRFLSWLHNTVTSNNKEEEEGEAKSSSKNEATKTRVTEVTAADKLLEFRKETGGDYFLGPSFETIPGCGGNGAIIHYRADPEIPFEKQKEITQHDMFLVDSGGQYLDGTTDVTRTVCFYREHQNDNSSSSSSSFSLKEKVKKWRTAYTLVLQGHVRLNSTIFPGNGAVTGHQLDALARLDLWKHGLNYQHGTSHGVMHCGNVHEGPMGIGFLPRPSDPGLNEGMVLSNEPGFYVKDDFGIRIENLDVIVQAPTDGEAMFYSSSSSSASSASSPIKKSLKLESLTMAPLCRALIDKSIMTNQEIEWVNNYHQTVFKYLAPRIEELKTEDKESVLQFLKYECAAL